MPPRLGLSLLLLTSCTHRILEGSVQPQPPPPPPEAPPARAFAVARVCPDRRPEASLFAARLSGGWTAKKTELTTVVRHSRLARLGIFTWGGKRGGAFTVGGATGPTPVVVGGFAGRHPCDPPALAASEPPDPVCASVMGSCALGIGWVDPPDLDSVPDPVTGTACVVEGRLVADLDRDGTPESFPLASLVAQEEEVTGGPKDGACARPMFAGRLSERLDLLGVVDLDEDGRLEVVLATRTRWILYAPRQSASRLDRVAILELSGSSSRP